MHQSVALRAICCSTRCKDRTIPSRWKAAHRHCPDYSAAATLSPGLEKDIAGLKREIRERDETIGDKERRIYELKKKNQELEKFKFVLDYKIKELKKQVQPNARPHS